MTSTYRPLSDWVARVQSDGSLGSINGGRERTDARTLRWFVTAWTRTRAGDPPALALVEEGTGAVVIELDNYSAPIPISPAGLTIVERTERGWPVIAEDSNWSALIDEPLQLRHLLLRRLVTEASAPLPPWLFHILDWHLVDELARRITLRYEGQLIDGPAETLRHWFTPAVPGLTSGLEQIDAGYHVDDPAARRQGAESLLTALRASDPDRLPRTTRAALIDLLAAVSATVPMFRIAVREAVRHLAGDPEVTLLSTDLLDPIFEAAAAGQKREQETTLLGEPGFALTVTRTARGRLLITASIAPGDDGLPSFLPVRIAVPGLPSRDRRLWIPLRLDRNALTGTVDLPLPTAPFDVTAAALPVTAATLRFAEVTELLESIRAADFATANVWLDTGDDLPEGHPVREAARRFEEEQ